LKLLDTPSYVEQRLIDEQVELCGILLEFVIPRKQPTMRKITDNVMGEKACTTPTQASYEPIPYSFVIFHGHFVGHNSGEI
jgi:hypothetical protein